MKIALGIFIGIFICCVLFIVVAPDSAHEVIDRIHGNSDSNGELSVIPGDNSEGGVISSDEKPRTVIATSKPVVRGNRKNPVPKREQSSSPRNEPIVAVGPFVAVYSPPKREQSTPRNEREMLDWLKEHNYDVAHGQGFYRISWQMQKPTSSKPTAIVVRNDGKVVPQYGHTIVNRGGASSMGGRATVINNGMTTSAIAKYENGSWGIEITRSFNWFPGRDSIKNVLFRAKKIKELNDEN